MTTELSSILSCLWQDKSENKLRVGIQLTQAKCFIIS